MAIGSDTYPLQHSVSGGYSNGVTYGFTINVNKNCLLKSGIFRVTAANGGSFKSVLYRKSDNVRIGQTALFTPQATGDFEIPFVGDVNMLAATNYWFCILANANVTVARTGTMAMPHAHVLTGPNSFEIQVVEGVYSANGDTAPTDASSTSREVMHGISLSPSSTPPNAPTDVVSNNPLEELEKLTSSWTYNATNGGQQSYQFRWRRV